jgi:hypothetical protein
MSSSNQLPPVVIPPKKHWGGEEILVLQGVFEDE